MINVHLSASIYRISNRAVSLRSWVHVMYQTSQILCDAQHGESLSFSRSKDLAAATAIVSILVSKIMSPLMMISRRLQYFRFLRTAALKVFLVQVWKNVHIIPAESLYPCFTSSVPSKLHVNIEVEVLQAQIPRYPMQ